MFNQFQAILKKIIERAESSKDTARSRLRLVLVQDRSGLATESLQELRDDLVEVISKYLVIDRETLQVDIHREGDAITLVSNIQIVEVQRTGSGQTPEAQTT